MADFVVDGKVVVELKATRGLAEVDEAQLLNYLKAAGMRVGLLFNFGTPRWSTGDGCCRGKQPRISRIAHIFKSAKSVKSV